MSWLFFQCLYYELKQLIIKHKIKNVQTVDDENIFHNIYCMNYNHISIKLLDTEQYYYCLVVNISYNILFAFYCIYEHWPKS